MKDNNLRWISKMTQQLKNEKKNLASCIFPSSLENNISRFCCSNGSHSWKLSTSYYMVVW